MLYPATFTPGGEFGYGAVSDGPLEGERHITLPYGQVDGLHPEGHPGVDFGWYSNPATKPEGNLDLLPIYSRRGGLCINSGTTSVNGFFIVVMLGPYAPGTLIEYLGHMFAPSPFIAGDLVSAGTVVGNVDNTGFSTGNHLHWGMWRLRDDLTLERVDPLSVLGFDPPPPVIGPDGQEEGNYDVPPRELRIMDIALAQVALAIVDQQLPAGHASVQLVDTGDDGQVGVLLTLDKADVLAAYPPGF